jgi:hypothetical protein
MSPPHTPFCPHYCSVISENMQYDYLSNSGFVPAVNEFGDQRGIKITKNAFERTVPLF